MKKDCNVSSEIYLGSNRLVLSVPIYLSRPNVLVPYHTSISGAIVTASRDGKIPVCSLDKSLQADLTMSSTWRELSVLSNKNSSSGKAVFNVYSRSSTAALNWTVKIVSISALIRNIPHDIIACQHLIAEL